MPRPVDFSPHSRRRGPASFSAARALAPPELRLLPADGPPGPGLHGGDVAGQLVAVQRVAHLGAEGVAGAEAARTDAEVLAGVQDGVPELLRPVGVDEQLVAVLAGVAGAADGDLGGAVRAGAGHEGHVGQLPGDAEQLEHLQRPGPLHGEDGDLLVPVGDRDPRRRLVGQPAEHLGGVGRVGHEQHVVRTVQVDDQVVDDAAGLRVAVGQAAERVLRLPRADLPEVVAQASVHELRRARPADRAGAEVGDVEEPDPAADGGVLGEDSPAGVLDGHRPPAEVGELGAGGDMTVVEGGRPGSHERDASGPPTIEPCRRRSPPPTTRWRS